MRRGSRCLAVTLLALAVSGRPAIAAEPSAARRAYDEATAAFGLGHYQEAAEKYETAFSLRPDPALLYNAAQAYRLAGNRPRALELYRNYLRLYPDRQNADEARHKGKLGFQACNAGFYHQGMVHYAKAMELLGLKS